MLTIRSTDSAVITTRGKEMSMEALRIAMIRMQEENDANERYLEVREPCASRANSYKFKNNKSKCYKCNRVGHWQFQIAGFAAFVIVKLIIKNKNAQEILNVQLKGTTSDLLTNIAIHLVLLRSRISCVRVNPIRAEMQQNPEAIESVAEAEEIIEVQRMGRLIRELNSMVRTVTQL